MSRKGWTILALALLLLLVVTVLPYNLWCWSCGINTFNFSTRGTGVWAILWLFTLLATAALLGIHFYQNKNRDKNRCPQCYRPSQPEWRVCPYCGTSKTG